MFFLNFIGVICSSQEFRCSPSNQEPVTSGYQCYSKETAHAVQEKQQFSKTAQLPIKKVKTKVNYTTAKEE